MKLIKSKKNKQLKVYVTENQQQKIRILSYYSGKTMGEIIRIVIDQFEVKKFNRFHTEYDNKLLINGLTMKNKGGEK